MTIENILEKFKAVNILSKDGDLISAQVSREELANVATILVDEYNLPLSLVFATDDRLEKNVFGLHVIFSLDQEHAWLKLSAQIPEDDKNYPALTKTIMAAHWYERYLADMFGIVPVGHPDLRRLVHHENIPQGTFPLLKDFAWNMKLVKIMCLIQCTIFPEREFLKFQLDQFTLGLLSQDIFALMSRGKEF